MRKLPVPTEELPINPALIEHERERRNSVENRQEWRTVKDEDKQNEELLQLSRQILELTKALHAAKAPASNGQAQ
jgi:hypothetical protein